MKIEVHKSLKSKMPKGNREIDRLEIKMKGNFVPRYQTPHSAGCDLCADIQEPVVLRPHDFCAIPTGIKIEIPPGYEAQVRPRSGLALKYGIGILNAPGTIDSDYRGEIKVILFNFGTKSVRIRRGDRIAQVVIAKVVKAEFKKVARLNRTRRGSGGFGHTGGIV